MPSYAKFYKPLMKVSSRITANAKIVLCALLDFKQLGVHNPKIEALRKAAGASRSTVDRALRELREIGLIQIRRSRRESIYTIAPVDHWSRILIRQFDVSQKTNPDASKVTRQNDVSEPAAPNYLQDSLEKHEDYVKTRKPSTRAEKADARPVGLVKSSAPDLLRTLEECCEIYRVGNSPIAPRRRQFCLQLMLSLPDDERARLSTRLPIWLAYAMMYLWSDAQHTKKLENVLHDGDWDVDPRTLAVPLARKPSLLEQQERLYFAHAAAQKD